MSKKLFRRIYNADYIPDDDLLHIFFDSSMLRLDISSYDSSLSKTYSRFFDAYSQAKRRRIFPKDLSAFIDSFLVHPKDFNVKTCHPFNTSRDDYYFDYEGDEDYTYIWLTVSLNFSRGDIFMDDNINFTLERIPKATREVTFSDGSVMTVTGTASMFEEWDAEEQNDENSNSQISNAENSESVSELPTPIAEVATAPPNIETLTAEIKMYLHIANQSIIEVGKRLIQAKELVPHGDWKIWLKDNFNLGYQTAAKFMQVANRLGKSRIDTTFGSTQLIALLSLPEGEEEKFIEEKAAEGNPADQMTIKQLRTEVKKWKDEFATSEKSNQGLESYISTLRNELLYYRKELDTTKDRARTLSKQLAQQKTVEVLPPDYADLKREVQELRNRPVEVATEFPADYASTKKELAQLKNREDSFKKDYALNLSLNQILSLIPTLLNADNLQSVVSVAADNDFSSFQHQLAQLAKLHSQLQKYLKDWEDTHINQTPIDRDVIIEELKQIMIQDSSTRTSSKIEHLISSLGYKKLLDIPDELLPDLLKKVRDF